MLVKKGYARNYLFPQRLAVPVARSEAVKAAGNARDDSSKRENRIRFVYLFFCFALFWFCFYLVLLLVSVSVLWFFCGLLF